MLSSYASAVSCALQYCHYNKALRVVRYCRLPLDSGEFHDVLRRRLRRDLLAEILADLKTRTIVKNKTRNKLRTEAPKPKALEYYHLFAMRTVRRNAAAAV